MTNDSYNMDTSAKIQMSTQFPGLTQDGAQWMMRALDPFHDDNLDKVGFPDHVGSASIVVEHMQMLTISAPGAIVAAGANWDCHVVQTPLALGQSGVGHFLFYSGATTLADPATTGIIDSVVDKAPDRFGGLSVDCVVSGTPTFSGPNTIGGRITLDAIGTLQQTVGGSYADTGRARLVASGFEIENTTAPLYRQGALTVYNSPSSQGTKVVRPADAAGTVVRAQLTVKTFSAPPRLEARARLMAGARTWHAEHGCYVPSRLNSLSNPPADFAGEHWLAEAADNGDIYPSLAPNGLNTSIVPGTTLANNCGACFANIIIPVDNAGAYLTGLSPQTTLTIVLRQTWELFPASNSTLARLSRPSPLYDPKALELYSHILRTLALGTVRGDNDGGKWFRTILSIARAVGAPAILRSLGHATGQGVVGEMAAHAVQRILDKQDAKKKAKKKPDVAIPTFSNAKNATSGTMAKK